MNRLDPFEGEDEDEDIETGPVGTGGGNVPPTVPIVPPQEPNEPQQQEVNNRTCYILLVDLVFYTYRVYLVLFLFFLRLFLVQSLINVEVGHVPHLLVLVIVLDLVVKNIKKITRQKQLKRKELYP